jgi:hypothetical protein
VDGVSTERCIPRGCLTPIPTCGGVRFWIGYAELRFAPVASFCYALQIFFEKNEEIFYSLKTFSYFCCDYLIMHLCKQVAM